MNVVNEDEGGDHSAKRDEGVEKQLQHEGGQEARAPGGEMTVDELNEAVEDGDDDAVDDVGEDVEHHLLENEGTVLRVRRARRRHPEQSLLIDGKTLQTVRHRDEHYARRNVDQNYPDKQELP